MRRAAHPHPGRVPVFPGITALSSLSEESGDGIITRAGGIVNNVADWAKLPPAQRYPQLDTVSERFKHLVTATGLSLRQISLLVGSQRVTVLGKPVPVYVDRYSLRQSTLSALMAGTQERYGEHTLNSLQVFFETPRGYFLDVKSRRLTEWLALPVEQRFPRELPGVTERFNHLVAATGLSHRRIADLVKEGRTITGERVEDEPGSYALSHGTLNDMARGERAERTNTVLRTLERFFDAPVGYLRFAEEAAQTGSKSDFELVAARLPGFDRSSLYLLGTMIEGLLSNKPDAEAGDGPHGDQGEVDSP
jgi:transcriptional regulator with XRE-family HTH domain